MSGPCVTSIDDAIKRLRRAFVVRSSRLPRVKTAVPELAESGAPSWRHPLRPVESRCRLALSIGCAGGRASPETFRHRCGLRGDRPPAATAGLQLPRCRAQGITTQATFNVCSSFFSTWKVYDKSLDIVVPRDHNIRYPDKSSYAIWVRSRVEADEEHEIVPPTSSEPPPYPT